MPVCGGNYNDGAPDFVTTFLTAGLLIEQCPTLESQVTEQMLRNSAQKRPMVEMTMGLVLSTIHHYGRNGANSGFGKAPSAIPRSPYPPAVNSASMI